MDTSYTFVSQKRLYKKYALRLITIKAKETLGVRFYWQLSMHTQCFLRLKMTQNKKESKRCKYRAYAVYFLLISCGTAFVMS